MHLKPNDFIIALIGGMALNNTFCSSLTKIIQDQTLMNKFAMSIGIVRYTAFLGLATALIGCGSSKTVITADDCEE